MAVYTYRLSARGVEAWRRNQLLGNGRTWREFQTEMAREPARAHGCESVRLVGPDGQVVADLDTALQPVAVTDT